MSLPAQPSLQMWFDFSSPYSYLAVARLPDLARQAGVRVAMRPFLLGPIFQAQGWNDTPVKLFPAKGAYVMRDVARLADKYAVPYRRPSVFPRMGILPARVALLGQDQPWAYDFCRAVFHANFADDRDMQSEDTVRELLRGLDLDADSLLAAARADGTKLALRRQVEQAQQLGIFGAPTMLAGDEMFWGNDRLEDALQWAVRHAGGGGDRW